MVLISADPKAGSMRMDWRVLREVNTPCRADNVGACGEIDIFFDTYAAKTFLLRHSNTKLISYQEPAPS